MAMSKKRDYRDYLYDMLTYATDAEQFISGMTYEQFAASRQTQQAVLYAITIIGEAATKIPAPVRAHYPSVPWRTVIDTRNRLIHGYEGILLHLVWNVIKDHIPSLKSQIAAVLNDMEQYRSEQIITECPPIPDTWPVAAHIAALRHHLPDLAQQYHIKSLGVFGSYVRNEQTPESDLDVLVEFDDMSHLTLLTIARIENELSDHLGIKVDLVLRKGLKPTIGRYILEEVVMI